jgi:CNT family concentrative nucleoside transporter
VSEAGARAVAAAGFVLLLALAWAISSDRRHVPWRAVARGVGLQLGLAGLLLLTRVGGWFFAAMGNFIDLLARVTDAGVIFLFGKLVEANSFAVSVLPIIVVMGSLFAVLYHLGIMQRVVDVLGMLLARTMGTSGAESLAAVANIFLGMTESALVVRPYLVRMTRSEIFSLMTVGMASVAGSVLVAYSKMLGSEYAGHLATASLLSAPAGLLIAKVMVPEREQPLTTAGGRVEVERTATNVFDAAAHGAVEGMRLAAYVGAMLIAFVALIALVNEGLGALGAPFGYEGLSLQRVLGFFFAPFAFFMGIPWRDAQQVGGLLGIKTVLNEFIAYQELAVLAGQGALAPRSIAITSYALCGFANFGSLAILLGGLGGLVPSRREEIARFGLRSIAAGTLSSFMTACVAGMLL